MSSGAQQPALPQMTIGSPPVAAHASPSQQHSPQERKASHHAPHGANSRSCITCRRRKVKCNKSHPCSNCTKAGSECIFPAPGRAPRRPRVGGKVGSEREAELLKRLRRLEGVVEELSGQVEVEAVKCSPSSDNSSAPKDGDAEGPHGKTRIVRVVGMDEGSGSKRDWLARSFRIGTGPPKTAYSMEEVRESIGSLVLDEGKSRYVASPFWASITDEVEEIRELLDDQEFDSDSDCPVQPTNVHTEPDHQSFIMGYNSSEVDLKALHPLPSQIPFYWQTFLENVNPLIKLIHVPTMNKVIKEVQSNMDSLSKSTEALMFSIYFATITSMHGEEVRINFGVSKDSLIRQYRFGTEQALARAGFLNTNEIVTVQAFVLFLVCVRRHDDSKFVWSLTGLALRISQSLGLHRDGTKFGLSPFDTEMRRRLWWQLCALDTRAAEDHASDPSILDFSFDTEFPLSINDEDLDPEATEFPKPQPGVSEMTFCLLRYEICFLSRKLTYTPPGATPCQLGGRILTLEDKEALIRDTTRHLEVTYLQYCNDAGPLYWVSATIARLIMAKMSLIIYHPITQPGKPSSLPQDIKDRLFTASIEIIEYSHILETEASTKKWGWLFHTYIQWHAIAFILGELCARDNSEIVARAWKALDVVFEDWGRVLTHTKSGLLWLPMRKLMAKARKKREENMQRAASEYTRPPLQAYAKAPPCPGNIAHDSPLLDQQSMRTSLTNSLPIQDKTAMISDAQPPTYTGEHIGPQIISMGNMAPDQIQLQMQGRQQDGMTWSMDESALPDLDMTALDGEVSWEGWDDLVRDFQMEQDLDEARGPAFGGIGQWW